MKLAIDLGGTNIRIAQVAEGKCLKRNSVACLATQDVDVILTQLFELIEPMIGETVEGIGIGVPSIVDTVHGIVYDADEYCFVERSAFKGTAGGEVWLTSGCQ